MRTCHPPINAPEEHSLLLHTPPVQFTCMRLVAATPYLPLTSTCGLRLSVRAQQVTVVIASPPFRSWWWSCSLCYYWSYARRSSLNRRPAPGLVWLANSHSLPVISCSGQWHADAANGASIHGFPCDVRLLAHACGVEPLDTHRGRVHNANLSSWLVTRKENFEKTKAHALAFGHPGQDLLK